MAVLDPHTEVTALFTAIAMPREAGAIALAAKARRRRPDLSASITSGTTEIDASGLLAA